MARGDLVSVPCFWGVIPYRHFGIDMGDGTVVHLATLGDSGPIQSGTMQVQRVRWEQFTEAKPVRVEDVQGGLAADEVIRRAEVAVGTTGYHLALGNCEHFARECKTGESVSHQSDRVIGSALRASVAGVVACSTRAATYAATYAASSGMARGIVSRTTGISSLIGEVARQGVYAASRKCEIEHRQADHLGKTAGTITAAIVGSVAGGPLGAASSAAIYLSIDHVTHQVWRRCISRVTPAEESEPYRKSNG